MRRRRAWGAALAALAGAAASFGFAPHALPGALLLGLTAWFLASWTCTPAQAALRGLAFGLGYFGFGVYWLYYTAHFYGQMPLGYAVLSTAALVLYLSLYPALAAGLAARLFRAGAMRLLATALLWGGLEWVRGAAFGGFPWVLVGQGSLDGPLQGYLPLVGVYGAGLLLLLLAALLASGLRTSLPAFGERAALAGILLVGGHGLHGVSWTEPAGAPQELALVQAGIPQEHRWRPEFLARTMQSHWELTAAARRVPLVFWPEAAIPQLFEERRDFYAAASRQLLGPDGTLVVGTFLRDPQTGDTYNGMINVRSGQSYRKRRMVPFGEQMPGRAWLGFLYENLRVPMQDLTPGAGPPVMHVRGEKVLVSICYEVIFPDLPQFADGSIGYLLNISNDGWFGDSRGPWQHLEAARARASELGRDLARVAGTGLTAVIGADGRVRDMLAQFEPGVLIASVQPRRGETPYMRWREGPFFLALAFGLLWCGYRARRARRRGLRHLGA